MFKGIVRGIGHEFGFRGIVADLAGKKLLKDVGGAFGLANTLGNIDDTSEDGLVSTGLGLLSLIPPIQEAAAMGSIGFDIYKTIKAVRACN